jgi:hypothetical protein
MAHEQKQLNFSSDFVVATEGRRPQATNEICLSTHEPHSKTENWYCTEEPTAFFDALASTVLGTPCQSLVLRLVLVPV